MNLSIIAAIGKNNELGKENRLLWNLPGDLKFFKNMTNGKYIVMGRKTFCSLPKLLPNRKHIVLTRNFELLPKEVEVFKNINDFLNKYKNINDEIFVIGGANIYEQFINLCDTLYLTEIENSDINADVYFPYFNKNDYDKENLGNGVDNGIKYQHIKYLRR